MPLPDLLAELGALTVKLSLAGVVARPTEARDITDRHRAALVHWGPCLLAFAERADEVITLAALRRRIVAGDMGMPPGFFVVPHETLGAWLAGPPDFQRDYYPDAQAARDAAWAWHRRQAMRLAA